MSTAASNEIFQNLSTCLGTVKLAFENENIPVAQIIEPKGSPDREPRSGDDDRLGHLARSIASVGTVLQPIMVERLADGRFARVFGRRRIAAVKLLGWTTIRAIVVPPLDDDIRRTIVAVENMQRQDLTPTEETLAVVELAEMRAKPVATRLKHPQSEIKDAKIASILLADKQVLEEVIQDVAGMLAKPATWVRDRMYLRKLEEPIRAMVRDGVLPLAHARELAKIAGKHADDCLALAKMFAAGGIKAISKTEPGKFEELRDAVRRRLFSLWNVPWQLNVAFEGMPACTECPHNSINQPGLFDNGGACSTEMIGGLGTWASGDVKAKKAAQAGVCTNMHCYASKLKITKNAVTPAAKKIAEDAIEKHGAQASKHLRASIVTTNVGNKTPKFVDMDAVLEKAEDVLDRKHKKAGAARSQSPEAVEKYKRQEEQRRAMAVAENDFRIAKREHIRKISEQLGKVIANKPYVFAMFSMLDSNKLVQACMVGQEKKRQKAIQSPAMKLLLKHMANPSPEGVLEIEKTCGRQFGLMEGYNAEGHEFACELAKTLGINVGKVPQLSDFLPQQQKEEPKQEGQDEAKKTHAAKPTKAAKANKHAKKAAKQKGAKA